jgi:hypothetical protein
MWNHTFIYPNQNNIESNLNTFLNSLVKRMFKTGYKTFVYGEIPNQIYVLLQCSRNEIEQQFFNRSQNVISTIWKICGNAIGSRVYSEDYDLHYKNGNFIGQLDYSVKYRYNPQNVSKLIIFNMNLNLSCEATYGLGYSSETTSDSLSRNICGLVQCWKDISTNNCQKCLSFVVNNIVTYYAGSQGVEGFFGSYEFCYEIYNFFYSIAPPSSPMQAPTPKHNNTTCMN